MKLISYKVWGNPKSTFLDYLVAIFSFGKYSHSELVFSNGECFSISPREKSARIKRFKIIPEHWDIIQLNIPPAIEGDLYNKALRLQTSSTKYDYFGALTSPLRLCLESKHKIFCSEICATFLATAGYNLEKGCKYTPSRLNRVIKKLSRM